MERAKAATERASALIQAALASKLDSQALECLRALLDTIAVAEDAKSKAGQLGEPNIKQTTDDGTILEQHDNAQLQRSPDGKTIVRFTNLLPAATGISIQAVVVIPSDTTVEPTFVQVGEVGNVQVQFLPDGLNVACFQKSGQTLQILLDTGTLIVKMSNGDVCQFLPVSASSSALSSSTSSSTSTSTSTPLASALLASEVVTKFQNGETSYTTVLRFQGTENIGLKGCTFGEQKSDNSAILHFPPDTDEIDKAHWTEDRLVVIFQDGTICERRKDGRVVVVEKLDDALQAAMSGTSSDSTNNSTNNKNNTIDLINFNSGNKVSMVKTLKGLLLDMMSKKKAMEENLLTAHAAYKAASVIWDSADASRQIAEFARPQCLEIASRPMPTDAKELAMEGTIMQEENQDGIKTVMVQLKSGTQRQIRFETTAGVRTTTVSVALSDQEEIVVAHPDLKGCLFSLREQMDENNTTTQSIIMLKVGPHCGTQVVHNMKNETVEHVGIVRDGRQIQFKYNAKGEVEVVCVKGDESSVQISVLTRPKRIAVVYDTGDLRLVQVNDKSPNIGLLVMRDGRVKHSLSSDGAFTIETAREDGASSALQLGPDGHLLIVKEDGSQWRWTGTELHAMATASINSPRAKLAAARKMDAQLNTNTFKQTYMSQELFKQSP